MIIRYCKIRSFFPYRNTQSDSCKIRYNVSESNSIGSMQLFSAFVTMQLPRHCRVSRSMIVLHLSGPLNLLLEPRAPQHCGFCGRVDFITFLPTRVSCSWRRDESSLPVYLLSLPVDRRSFYSALINAGVVRTLRHGNLSRW